MKERAPSIWTIPEALEIFEHGVAAGETAGRIAAALTQAGYGITRSAVCGRARRQHMKLGGENHVEPTSVAHKIAMRQAVREARASKPKPPLKIRAAQGTGQEVRLMDAGPRACRFGLRGAGLHLVVCGARVQDGRPYCATHMAIAYTPVMWRTGIPSDRTRIRSRLEDEGETDLVSLFGEDA